jgi:hypothetical protein
MKNTALLHCHKLGLYKLSDGNGFNIGERVDTIICQAAKFPERLAGSISVLCFFTLIKIRLPRKMATNIQSFGSED